MNDPLTFLKPNRSRLLNRERGRRFRARRKAGEGLARIKYPAGLVDMLLQTGWLAADLAPGDTRSIDAAFEAWVADTVENYMAGKRR
jgi:hypothetical protein